MGWLWLRRGVTAHAASGRVIIGLIAILAPFVCAAAEPIPRSVLILDQSDADSPWYARLSSAFRSTLAAASTAPVSVYAEHLDLSRFEGPRHAEALRAYLRDKFRDRPIGVIVAQGSTA